MASCDPDWECMAGCASRTDIEIEGSVDGFTVNAQMRLSTERQASRGSRVANALLHSNRCFFGARVPITTGPREWRY